MKSSVDGVSLQVSSIRGGEWTRRSGFRDRGWTGYCPIARGWVGLAGWQGHIDIGHRFRAGEQLVIMALEHRPVGRPWQGCATRTTGDER
jgi:hypothetical protein